MKKWLISNNGTITGPMAFEAVKTMINDHENLYLWQPSYTHWMPASCVEEFSGQISAPQPPSPISQQLIDQFISKETMLLKKLNVSDEQININVNLLADLSNEIERFKVIVKNCSFEVQSSIDSIEREYQTLQDKLNQATKSAQMIRVDVVDVCDEVIQSLPEQESPIELCEEPMTPPVITKAETPVKPDQELEVEQTRSPDPKIDKVVHRTSPIMNKIEYSEEVSARDIKLMSRMSQAQSSGENTLLSYEKTPTSDTEQGDFDYLLTDIYEDDGKIGQLLEDSEGSKDVNNSEGAEGEEGSEAKSRSWLSRIGHR